MVNTRPLVVVQKRLFQRDEKKHNLPLGHAKGAVLTEVDSRSKLLQEERDGKFVWALEKKDKWELY